MTTKLGEIQNLSLLSTLGKLPGVIPWAQFAYGRIGSVYSTIYSPGRNPGLYPYLSAQMKIKVASTSNNDTLLGSGCPRVLVKGCAYDEDGELKFHQELIDLQGQTPVESATEFYRVYEMIAVGLVGHDVDGQLYAGGTDQTFSGGEPTDVIGHVDGALQGLNKSQMGVFTVPSDYYLVIKTMVLTPGIGKECFIIATGRPDIKPTLAACDMFHVMSHWMSDSIPFPINHSDDPIAVGPNTDIEVRAFVDTGTLNVSVSMSGLLIPTKYFGSYRDYYGDLEIS